MNATDLQSITKLTLAEAIEQAKEQLAAVTGLKPVTITKISKDEEGWRIEVEMLEMCRIPTAMDVLGDYEVVISDIGDMLKFERKRTRLRGELSSEESE